MLVSILLACGLFDQPESADLGTSADPAAPSHAKAAVPKPPGVHLAALVATSGYALPLMDGDPKTSWRPNGDYADEGVLFRFEQPTTIEGLQVGSCGEAGADFSLYLDGSRHPDTLTMTAAGGELDFSSRAVRSVFLRVDHLEPKACLGEVSFLGTDVRAPRTLPALVTASSTLEPVAAYRPPYLFDGQVDFGWVEGAEGLGIGESVRAQLLGDPLELHAVEIWNGYQRSEDHFQKNGRAARIAIVTDEGRVELDLADRMGSQKLILPQPVETRTVTLEIVEGVPGSRYQDLVLSEARLWDRQGPLQMQQDWKRAAFGRLTQARQTALANLVDRLLVDACSPEQRRLKLRSNGSFVWWDAGDMDGSEVFDGTWVFRGPKEGGTELQLFGRRHRTSVDWSAYGSETEEQTIRIGGGKPVFSRVSELDEATFARKLARIEDANGGLCDLSHEELKARDAVLVEGTAFMAVLVRDSSRG